MRRSLSALLLAAVIAPGLIACAGDDPEQRSAGRSLGGDGNSTDLPESAVVSVSSETGADAVTTLVESSPVVVVASDEPAAQGVAASAAVGMHAPMLTVIDGHEDEVVDAVDQLGADNVLAVGNVELSEIDATVVNAPDDITELESVTGVSFAAEEEFSASFLDDLTVHQNAEAPVLARVKDDDAEVFTSSSDDDPSSYDGEPLKLDATAWSGDSAPTVLVTDSTPLAAVVSAVSSGAEVAHLRAPDPRVDGGAVEAVSGDRPVLAFGPKWGDTATFEQRLEQARTQEELPGGGQLIFPGRRFVAAYGSPLTEALGILGEQGPEESVERVRALVEQYQPYSPEPVIPAFEIIGTVASEFPGEDGNYTNEWDPEEFVPLIDAITEGDGYAVIDLQPGMASLLDQAKPFAELLKRPNVGLALDPEWKMEPGQLPGQQIGSADAKEINEVIDWLAELAREADGPQKLLILHQFNMSMITNRDKIDTSHPEIAIALHADGHGTPGMKMDTWNVLREDLDPKIWMAWKNFYDEDSPTFTPEETMAVRPRPWFVSYQ